MTEETLSNKLFVQKDGKKFAYAKDIRKSVKKLKDKTSKMWWRRILYPLIDKTFGDELR